MIHSYPGGHPKAVADPPARKITREVLLAAALEIIDRDGADGLSMRCLAGALDRDRKTICRHVPNKVALLDGVAETRARPAHGGPCRSRLGRPAAY